MRQKNLLEALREGLGLVHHENKISSMYVEGIISNESVQSLINEETCISDCVITELHWTFLYLQNTSIVITRTIFTNPVIQIEDSVLKTKHMSPALSIINDSAYESIFIKNSLIDGLFIVNSKNKISIHLKDCIFTKDISLTLKKNEISTIFLENCSFINGAQFHTNGIEGNIDLTIDRKTLKYFNPITFPFKVQ